MPYRYALPFLFGILFVAFSGCLPDEVDVNYYHYSDEDYDIISQELTLPQDPHQYIVSVARRGAFPGVFGGAVSNDIVALGRVLFYDQNISSTREVSCASCHRQELAFSDDVPLSKGVADNRTKRNSQALGSIVSFSQYYNAVFLDFGGIPYFWDERAATASDQILETLQNPDEMDMDLPLALERIQERNFYPVLYRKAFGDEEITEERTVQAIGEFVLSLASFNSRFDQGMQEVGRVEEPFPNFNLVENQGKTLFLRDCASCHSTNFGVPTELVANNGLDREYSDKGMGDRDGYGADKNGFFKVPPLRNIEMTAPYMHDGRFATLRDVINHYSTGVQPHPNLSRQLVAAGEPRRLNYSEAEKEALEAFLKTVTDHEFLNDPKFSDPFKR
jgi:cytochrome c peroxidase